jgi:hypothetical protein
VLGARSCCDGGGGKTPAAAATAGETSSIPCLPAKCPY